MAGSRGRGPMQPAFSSVRGLVLPPSRLLFTASVTASERCLRRRDMRARTHNSPAAPAFERVIPPPPPPHTHTHLPLAGALNALAAALRRVPTASCRRPLLLGCALPVLLRCHRRYRDTLPDKATDATVRPEQSAFNVRVHFAGSQWAALVSAAACLLTASLGLLMQSAVRVAAGHEVCAVSEHRLCSGSGGHFVAYSQVQDSLTRPVSDAQRTSRWPAAAGLRRIYRARGWGASGRGESRRQFPLPPLTNSVARVPVRLHALGDCHQYAEHPILPARLACTGSGSEAVTDLPAGQDIVGGRTSGVNGSTATAASASCSLTFDTAHLVILDALIVFGLPSLFSLGPAAGRACTCIGWDAAPRDRDFTHRA
jgi:hypothetical protein